MWRRTAVRDVYQSEMWLENASRLKCGYYTRGLSEVWGIIAGHSRLLFPPSAAVGQGSVKPKQSGFVHRGACVQFHAGPEPSPQIPPESQRFPALSHTYCPVAYLVKPASIGSLLQEPLSPPFLWASRESTLSLSLCLLSLALPPSLSLPPCFLSPCPFSVFSPPRRWLNAVLY